MINAPLDKIDKAMIESLIENSVPESRTLEYKETLPGRAEKDNHEFLADVTAIANSSGGDLIFGIKEKRDSDNKTTGEPQEACGVGQQNLDEEIRRLDNLLRNGVDPRLPVMLPRIVDGFTNGPVIIYRIPKSWAAPHMIRASNRFYARTTREKYPLDVREIRASFALSEALPERIRRFRDDRLVKIIANETPIPLVEGAKIVLHVLPVSAVDSTINLNMPAVLQKIPNGIQPMAASGWIPRFNFDGYIWFTGSPAPSGNGRTYAQLFRNGAIEMVEANLLQTMQKKKLIPTIAFERELLLGLQRCLDALKVLELQPPCFVMLTLLGVKGYVMWYDDIWLGTDLHPIDRDMLLLPEQIVESYTEKVEQILRPMFDSVWQASGIAQSLYYDKDGNWKPRA